jgi:trimeric autotransporter adhesin
MGFRLFTFALLLSFVSLGTTSNLRAQIIDTYAGNGSSSWTGDGGPATLAGISPMNMAFDSAGNCYITDWVNHRVRRVDAVTGTITTVVGIGTAGYSGDGGAATSAQLNHPTGIVFDNYGNLYVADQINACVRMVNLATGVITTVAGNGTPGFSGDGGPATLAALNTPDDLAIDSSNHLYIADVDNNCVRMVDLTTGIITTFAGNGTWGYSGDGGPATLASFRSPLNLAVDSSNHLYISDAHNACVRVVDLTTGIITTFAGNGTSGFSGDGGPATLASLVQPSGIGIDSVGNVYIADFSYQVIRMVTAATGIITTIAGNGTQGFSGDGGPALSALMDHPYGMIFGPGNNLYFADGDNFRVRYITGLVTVLTPTPTVEPKCQGSMKVSKNRFQINKDNGPLIIGVDVCLPSKYVLAIYNTAGEMVRQLRNDQNSPPIAENVEWDGKNQTGEKVASGIYQIRFVTSFTKINAKVIVTH